MIQGTAELVNLTPVSGKVMEQLTLETTSKHMAEKDWELSAWILKGEIMHIHWDNFLQ